MIKAGMMTLTECETLATREQVLDACDVLDAFDEANDTDPTPPGRALKR